MKNSGCYHLKGIITPFTHSDITDLAKLYTLIKEGLGAKGCPASEASGSLVASCDEAGYEYLVALWIEPPALERGAVEAFIGFQIEGSSPTAARDAFSVIAEAVARIKPARFTVKLY